MKTLKNHFYMSLGGPRGKTNGPRVSRFHVTHVGIGCETTSISGLPMQGKSLVFLFGTYEHTALQNSRRSRRWCFEVALLAQNEIGSIKGGFRTFWQGNMLSARANAI